MVKYTLYVQLWSLNPLLSLEYFYLCKLRSPKLLISKGLLKFAILFVHSGFYIEYIFLVWSQQRHCATFSLHQAVYLEITGAELKFKAGKTTLKIVPTSSKITILC